MLGAGDHDQVEVFVRLDEGIGQPHRHVRVCVVVEFTVDEQQLAFQVGGQRGVRDRRFAFGTEIAVVVLGPHRQVEGVVMIARDRDGHRVEVWIAQYGTRRSERARGLSRNPDSGGVQPRIPLSEFADRGDMVV